MTTTQPLADSDWMNTALSIFKIGGNVLEDPALPEVTGLIEQLASALTSAPSGTPPAVDDQGNITPPSQPGIGLHYAVTPLKMAVFFANHKVLLALAAVGVIALPVGAGYLWGRSRKRA